MLFDEAEEPPEPTLGWRTRSTPTTKERYAFLKTKKVGAYWYEGGGRFLYRKGACGVTVYDLGESPPPPRGST